jgi:DnaJ family protein C protein 11
VEVGGGTEGMEVDVKAGTQFGRYYWSTFQGVIGGEGRNMFVVQLSNQITASSIGSLTWRVGSNLSGLQCSYMREVSPNRFVASLHLGIPHSFALLSYSRKADSRGEKYKGAVKAGTFGAFVEYGIEKKISELSVVSATMVVGLPMGVTLKLKVQRNSQSYVFPVQLAEDILPAAVFYGTITPFVLYMITKKLFLDPYQEEKKRREKEKLKEQYKERLKEKRAEAEAAINLMHETYSRVEAEEKSKHGLVITEAYYGSISSERELSSEIINVKIPLQCLVKSSKLLLPSGCKSQLPGFYDPAPGEEKKLLIRYTYNEQAHESLSRDTDAIKLPKLSHKTDQV